MIDRFFTDDILPKLSPKFTDYVIDFALTEPAAGAALAKDGEGWALRLKAVDEKRRCVAKATMPEPRLVVEETGPSPTSLRPSSPTGETTRMAWSEPAKRRQYVPDGDGFERFGSTRAFEEYVSYTLRPPFTLMRKAGRPSR